MEQKKNFKTILIALLLAGAILGSGYGLSTLSNQPIHRLHRIRRFREPMVPANFSELAEKVRPGVVNIQVVKKVKNIDFGFRNFRSPYGDKNPFGDFFGPFLKEIRPGTSNSGVSVQGLS